MGSKNSKTSKNICKQVDPYILDIINNIKVRDNSDETKCENLCEELFHCIKKNYPTLIDRKCLSGSLGKGTSVIHKFDIDLILFVNLPDHNTYIQERSNIVSDMKWCLIQHFRRRIQKCFLNDFSLQFKLDSFDVDLHLAYNACIHPMPFSIDNQYNEIVNIITSTKEAPYTVAFQLSTSMSEYAVGFVRDQSPFVINLVILCKHWLYKCVGEKAQFKGRSSVFELIAIHVGREFEKKHERPSLAYAFENFLEECSHLDKLKIEFESPLNKHLFGNIKREVPYALDPINPYNNRLHKLHSERQILDDLVCICRERKNQYRDLLYRGSERCLIEYFTDFTFEEADIEYADLNIIYITSQIGDAKSKFLTKGHDISPFVPFQSSEENKCKRAGKHLLQVVILLILFLLGGIILYLRRYETFNKFSFPYLIGIVTFLSISFLHDLFMICVKDFTKYKQSTLLLLDIFKFIYCCYCIFVSRHLYKKAKRQLKLLYSKEERANIMRNIINDWDNWNIFRPSYIDYLCPYKDRTVIESKKTKCYWVKFSIGLLFMALISIIIIPLVLPAALIWNCVTCYKQYKCSRQNIVFPN